MSDNQNNYTAYLNIGNVLKKKGEFRKAIIEYENFLNYAPKYHPEYNNVKNSINFLTKRLGPDVNPEDFPKVYDKDLFDFMTRYFTRVNKTDLINYIPKKDTILSSLLCFATFTRQSGNTIRIQSWRSHVILTKYGFAYINRLGEYVFHYWNQIKKTSFKRKEFSFAYGTFSFRKGKLKTYFPRFCKALYKNFINFTKEMKKDGMNKEFLNKKIETLGMDNFIEQLNTFYNSGFNKESMDIAKNALELISKTEIKKILYLIAYMHFNESQILIKKNPSSKKICNELQESVKYYNMILELDPKDSKALAFRDPTQKLFNFYSIPAAIRAKAEKLYMKANKKIKKDKFEEGINLLTQVIEMNPYEDKFKNRLEYLKKHLNLENLGLTGKNKSHSIRQLERVEKIKETHREGFREASEKVKIKQKEPYIHRLAKQKVEKQCILCGANMRIKDDLCPTCGESQEYLKKIREEATKERKEANEKLFSYFKPNNP